MSTAFEIIGHSLGVYIPTEKELKNKSPEKIKLPDNFYRNYYCYGYTEDKTRPNRMHHLLSAFGFIEFFERLGTLCFCVTEKGKKAFIKKYKKDVLGKYKKIKPSRSKIRYLRYIEYGDGFDNFLDFCYWHDEKERSWNH